MLASIEMPIVHVGFVVLFLISLGITLVSFLTAILQKSLRWKRWSLNVLVLTAIFALGILLSGMRSALTADFHDPALHKVMYMHIGSGIVTVVLALFIGFLALRRWRTEDQSVMQFSKKILIYLVVLLAFAFFTLNLGQSLLEGEASQDKEEVLYGY